MRRLPGIFILGISVLLAAGCGGNSLNMQGTVVTAVFVGPFLPQAVATQSGSGPFKNTSLDLENAVSVVVPAGTTNYAIAYVCNDFFGSQENVIEASIMDRTTLTVDCFGASTTPGLFGLATGSVDASAISGANALSIGGVAFRGLSMPFTVGLPNGFNDVAFVAFNSSRPAPLPPFPGSALGVKILPAQAVPGVVNNGRTVVFGPGDVTTLQPTTVLNLPTDFILGGVSAEYHTAGGAIFQLSNGFDNPTMYPAVPAASVQKGDFYRYSLSAANDLNPTLRVIGTSQTTSSGGGPVTIALPAVWSFDGPTPAVLPTFTFNYSGFSTQPAVSQQVFLSWNALTNSRTIAVTATANFQKGATTLAVPDLSALNGFFAPAASGTTVFWSANIMGGTTQNFIFSMNPPPNGFVSFVQNQGTYIVP